MANSSHDIKKHVKTAQSSNVHKFGGSSLKDKVCLLSVLETIKTQSNVGDYIVVSANGEVTNLLFSVVNHRACQQLHVALNDVKNYINELVKHVLDNPDTLLASIAEDLRYIESLCAQSQANMNDIVAYGEVWSAQLLHELMQQEQLNSHWLDARNILKMKDQSLNIDDEFMINTSSATEPQNEALRYIITGYIASDSNGSTITLGRNGSDYTATLLAKYLNAPCVYFWTDVDGVYSADPRQVKSAKKIKHLSFCEAQALSELGSNVFHQKTVNPIIDASINMVINCSTQTSNGTMINRRVETKQEVKTIACKNHLIGLHVQGINELDTRKLQALLLNEQIFSYANRYDKTKQEYHCYVEPNDLFNAVSEGKSNGYALKKTRSEVSLISVVGQDIRQNHQIIGKILSRSSAFDVIEIIYPANSHTLCLLIADDQATVLLNDLHQTFFELEASIPIVVLGYGNIGQQFLKILQHNKKAIENTVNRSLTLAAVANSRYFVVEQDQKNSLFSLIRENGLDLSLGGNNKDNAVVDVLKKYQGHKAIIVDLTASQKVALLYEQFAKNHWHIISANKCAAADCLLADSIESRQKSYQGKWLKNTTVGAGLPVQATIKKLQESGDDIKSLSGVFSGSLSWLFGQFDGTVPFSSLLREAQSQAFTEPDPREDLSGQDVFRKVRILARELGFNHAQEQFEPAVPQHFLRGNLSDFWNKAHDLDTFYNNLYNKEQLKSNAFRYIASITPEKLSVKLQVVDKNSPYAHLNPCDNIFIIHSDYYGTNPLIIRGPGAGKEVTAAGVLNDLIKVLKY